MDASAPEGPCSFFLALYIQPQRIAFLPGGKSTRVQVWLSIKLESSSRIESIHASDLLASANT